MEEIKERGRTKANLEKGWYDRIAYWRARAEEDARRIEAGKANLRQVLLEYAENFAKKEAREGIDFLTGLFTKRVFGEEVRFLVSFCNRYEMPLGILYIDIDKFKEEVNDKYGHPTGDRALMVFAKTLLDAIRESDLPARVGGEEFAVLLPGVEQGTLDEIAERIRKKLKI